VIILSDGTKSREKGILHLIKRVEGLVAKIVFAEMLPNVFYQVQFWTVRRKKQQGHIVRHTQFFGIMPSSSVKKHKAMDILEFTRYMGKKQRHYFGIYPWHHQGGELGAAGADSGSCIYELPYHLASHDGSLVHRRPTASPVTDAPKTAFILEYYSELNIRG